MKEIGGYIELDNFSGQEYHEKAISLNCGRNCLAYLIEAKKIFKLYIPRFLCSSVEDVAKKYGVVCQHYNINEELKPLLDVCIGENEYVYIVNYYGTLADSDIEQYRTVWKNIIIDHTQDFFRMPLPNVDTIYSIRKWFGVSDGAYLYTNKSIERALDLDISVERIHYVLGRYEKNATDFFEESSQNNENFAIEPVKKMSKLTHNILRALDYSAIQNIRTSNYKQLSKRLQKINLLNIGEISGAFAYPLYLKCKGAGLRKKLIERKIYVPTLWPDVLPNVTENSLEYKLVQNILPLPCDQRYGIKEMDYISDVILEIYEQIDRE